MKKKRINITLDEDVLKLIDARAANARLERSAYINQYFANTMPKDWTPPADKPKRKR